MKWNFYQWLNNNQTRTTVQLRLSVYYSVNPTYTLGWVHSSSCVLQNILVSYMVHQGQMRGKNFQESTRLLIAWRTQGEHIQQVNVGSSLHKSVLSMENLFCLFLFCFLFVCFFFKILAGVCWSHSTVYSDRRLGSVVCYDICSTKVNCETKSLGNIIQSHDQILVIKILNTNLFMNL